MLRKYLLNIHRFYYYFYPSSLHHTIMPCIVASLTINMLFYTVDAIFLNGYFYLALEQLGRYSITFPYLSTTLFLYLWYRKNLPSINEIKRFQLGMWGGVFACIVSMVIAILASV